MKITITQNERDFDISAAWHIIGQILNKTRIKTLFNTRDILLNASGL